MSATTVKNGDSKPAVIAGAVPTIVKPEQPETSRPEPAASNAPVDYFSNTHANPAPNLTSEQNPFELQFGGGGDIQTPGGTAQTPGIIQTPGGTKLPSVADLTAGARHHLGDWPSMSSLRSGPLSPNMLSGPTRTDDYFGDHHMRTFQGHHTESGIRSGLTPGGSGSMFPNDSLNTPALNSLFGTGGSTPSTNDFMQTAVHAKQLVRDQPRQNITSQPQLPVSTMDVKPPAPFDHHDPNEAANGLIYLANNNRAAHAPSHYVPVSQAPIHGHPQPMHMANHSQEASPNMDRRNGSTGTVSQGPGSDASSPENDPESRPNTRGKGKRSSTQISQSNGRAARAPEPRAKVPKRANGKNNHAMEEPDDEPEEVLDLSKDEYNANGKKMTDEDKRKNFLERNRVAALKCRQRKKQWLSNLQQKADNLEQENIKLTDHITMLTAQIHELKSVLMNHEKCEGVSQQMNHGSMAQQQQQQAMDYNGQVNGQMNPYGMAAVQQQQAMGPLQHRRFSNTMA